MINTTIKLNHKKKTIATTVFKTKSKTNKIIFRSYTTNIKISLSIYKNKSMNQSINQSINT